MHTSLPDDFIERLRRIVPDENWTSVLASFDAQNVLVLRVNTLLGETNTVIHALAEQHIDVTPIPWKQDALIVPHAQRSLALNSRCYQEGLVYSQNLSSQLAPMVLAPQPGEEVLDLCAAPGGKTLQMACMMRDQGRIAAVEKIKARFFKLKANILWQNAHCVQTYLADGVTIGRKTPERFDRVLLDAPCSSESRFKTFAPETYAHWRLRKIKEMNKKQKALLRSAIQCFKPGAELVYSTCAFAPEENEAVIDHALRKFGDTIEILTIDLPINNLQAGLIEWGNKSFAPEVQRSLRILPNEIMNGFFLCRIKKQRSTVGFVN